MVSNKDVMRDCVHNSELAELIYNNIGKKVIINVVNNAKYIGILLQDLDDKIQIESDFGPINILKKVIYDITPEVSK